MWAHIARIILKNKITWIVLLALITAFMGYRASKIELSYEFAKVLPSNDTTYQNYLDFKSKFGEEANVMILGLQSDSIFKLEMFQGLYDLAEDIKKLSGIQDVLGITRLYNISRNDSLMKFDFQSIVTKRPNTQAEVDSIKKIILSLPFYDGLVYNKESKATVMAITFNKKDLNSKNRITLVKDIKVITEKFSQNYNVKMRYSGIPYIRTEMMNIVSKEMFLFLALSILITALILFLFFRSFGVVFFSMLVVIVGVIWSVGTLQLLGYKISILTGMVPSIIIIIGLPNCIFLINKYHSEFAAHHNQALALTRMIEKVGLSLLLANVTTAIGFGVFYFTNSVLLMEFGIVTAINVMSVYFLTLIFIPLIFSFLPPPSTKRTKHLNYKAINVLLAKIDWLVHYKRPAIYIFLTVVTSLGVIGMYRINLNGFVVDDLPTKHPIYDDLHFLEKNFHGVMPFEIYIDTKKEKGVFSDNAKALYKIKQLQKIFAQYPQFSKPLSVVEGLKFSNQAYHKGEKKYYILPGITDLKDLAEYAGTAKGQESKLKTYIDSTNRYTRVSYQVADIGSKKMKILVAELKPRIDSVLSPKEYNVKLTGHSLVFLKNNDYLLHNLLESLLIEVILIIIIGMFLFRSIRIILLSKLPCLIPLVITAGIMGFANVSFKPSTILVFTIAFGISSDHTIYFLTRYRAELKKNNQTVSQAISITLRETGVSMIYSAIILFAGFAVFSVSSFGGTKALGILVSTTLLVSTATNLILLPSMFLSLDKFLTRKEFTEEQMIDIEEHHNDDKFDD